MALRGEAAIEDGVGVCRHWFPAATWVRAGVASRVCQLKADEQIVGVAEMFGMCADERLAEAGEFLFGVWADAQLIGVGAAVVTYRDGFTSQINFAPLRRSLPSGVA